MAREFSMFLLCFLFQNLRKKTYKQYAYKKYRIPYNVNFSEEINLREGILLFFLCDNFQIIHVLQTCFFFAAISAQIPENSFILNYFLYLKCNCQPV